jgi:ABC-type transport system substrate-binding protein
MMRTEGSPGLPRRAFVRGLLGVGGAVCAASVLAACGGGTPPAAAPPTGGAPSGVPAATGPKRGGTLKVALNSDIIGVDPHGASAGVDRNVYTAIYNGLVAPDKNLNIVPDLAASWATPDPKTYVFKLRPNLKFHDGTACDAEAVKRTSTGSWTRPTPPPAARRSPTSTRSRLSIR